jgi:von Willebrand factor type A domain-containing protein
MSRAWTALCAGCLLAGCGGDKAAVCDPAACQPGWTCSVGGPCIPEGGCFDARDCRPAQSCNEGACSFTDDAPCRTDQECMAGEFCSGAERCIAIGSCADAADCLGGDDCSPGGLCLPEGECQRDADCHAGTVCQEGACVPGGDCGQSEYGSDTPPNLLILLDRSGSMNDPIDGTPKWDIAVDAVTSTIGGWDGAIRFGLALFSNCEAGGDCAPGALTIPCADGTSDDIVSALGTAPRCSSTPIGASLDAMVGQETIQDAARRNAILLVTDGMDSCGGDPPAGAAALLAQATSVATYVVGFGAEVDAGQLTATAASGGTGDYYQADDAGGLGAALAAIAGRLVGCVYPLSGVPEDPALLYVFFNNEPDRIPNDETNGWRYDAATHSVVFSGDVCDEIQAGDVRDIDIVYGCPEPVI